MPNRDAPVADDVEDVLLDRAIIHGSEHKEGAIAEGTVFVLDEGVGCIGHGVVLVWFD
jgi:hypothetical protein